MLSLFLAAVLVAPPAAPCTAATSIHSTVAEIGSNLDRFMGKCVTVSGPFSGLAMFGGVEDMYLTSRFAPDGNYDRAAEKKGRLGLDSPKSDLRGLNSTEFAASRSLARSTVANGAAPTRGPR